MQNKREARKTNSGQFARTYKVSCQKKSVKPLSSVQTYLQDNCLKFCADRVDLRDWSPILKSIAGNRSLSSICIYSRCRVRKIREKINSEEKITELWRCRGKTNRSQPILYTNFLLRCLLHSVANLLRESSAITSLVLDGIPLGTRYLNILCTGLEKSRKLRNLSLSNCHIGDTGCIVLLESLQNNPSLMALNLSSCSLSNRSAMSISLFLRKKKAYLLENDWKESTLQFRNETLDKEHPGLQVLVLNGNPKMGDTGIRELSHVLRGDFWLRSLSLKNCGITKSGGEVIVELLQINSVLTKMDLKQNKIPDDILTIVLKILKTREKRGERTSLRRRLTNWKCFPTQSISRKIRANDNGIIKIKHSKNQLAKLEKDFMKKGRRKNVSEIEGGAIKESRKRLKNISKIFSKTDNYENDNCRKGIYDKQSIGMRELKSELLTLKSKKFDLVRELMGKRKLLNIEKHRRLKTEKEYNELKLQLDKIERKTKMHDCLHLKMQDERMIIKNIKSVFHNFDDVLIERKSDWQSEIYFDENINPQNSKRSKIINHLQGTSYFPSIKYNI